MELDHLTATGQFEHALLDALFDDAPVGLGVFDLELRHVRANATLAQMNGLPESDLIGRTPSELHGELGVQAETLYRQVLDSGVPLTGIEVSGATGAAPGDPRHWSLHFFPIKVAGATAGLCVLVMDITERRVLEDQLSHRASHDPLTGLPNRMCVGEQLTRLLSRRAPAPDVGVMFVDVDNFKDVNDRHGHSAGDEVLRAVAERLPQVVRPSDITGRWGGDEFVLLVDDVTGGQVDALVDRVDVVMRAPVTLGTDVVHPRVSVGATIARPGEGPDVVLERADSAMYARKRARVEGDGAA
ncbi:MAG: diguanylate cyclase [Solirubrobacteraceae bacterium]|nr:diguanylate cyclase [Solirubrobacteraceae bacterium]